MTYITIAGLYVDHLPLRISPQYTFALSWELLAWIPGMDGILSSFSNFITNAELSGPLYISPDIYHTQITEYLLETILQRYDSKWALFLSASKVFLIAILLVTAESQQLSTIGRSGPLGSTFPMLFQ